MSWRVLYPIEDLTPYLPKDESLAAGVKVLVYGGVDPRVHDVASIADRAIKQMQATKMVIYRRQQRKEQTGGKRFGKQGRGL